MDLATLSALAEQLAPLVLQKIKGKGKKEVSELTTVNDYENVKSLPAWYWNKQTGEKKVVNISMADFQQHVQEEAKQNLTDIKQEAEEVNAAAQESAASAAASAESAKASEDAALAQKNETVDYLNTVKANEDERISAENARKEAEADRVEKEAARAQAIEAAVIKNEEQDQKLSELDVELNGVQFEKSYNYNVGNRPNSSVSANPVFVDFKAPCTIELGVKDVSFPDDIVDIILYLRDANGNVINGNGTTINNNNNLVLVELNSDAKYITMYSNNTFLKSCTITIVAKQVGSGLKELKPKIEDTEKILNKVEGDLESLTLKTVGKYDIGIEWVKGKFVGKDGKLYNSSANVYATEKYYNVNARDEVFTNCVCYGDSYIAFYNSNKVFVDYIQNYSSNVINVPNNDEIKYARFTHRAETVLLTDVYLYKKKDINMQAEIDRISAMSVRKQLSAKILNFDKFSGDGWSVLENKISATTTSNNSLSYPISWAEQDSIFSVNAIAEGETFEFGFGKYAISTDAGTAVYGSMFGVRKTASADYLVTYKGDWIECNVLPLDNVKLTPGALITISVREYISERFTGRVFDITLIDADGNKDIVTNVGSSYPYINDKPLFDKGHKISTTGQNCGYPIFKMISGSRLTIRNFSFSFPRGNDAKLLICGHSYVEGNSLQGEGDQINCFASQMKKELPTSQVLGWGGDDFTRFETYYRTLLDWFPMAEYMLIYLGGNDKYNGVKAYSTEEGQNWLINKIKAVNETLKSYNVIPIWVTINPLKLEGFAEPTIVNNFIKSNVLSVDVVELFYKDGSFVSDAFLSDNVHPTKEVHAKILERIKTQAPYLFVDI